MVVLILVTLGTQDKQFTRLLDSVEKAIEEGYIKDKVIVQAGFTKYESKNMEIFDSMDRDKFSSFMNEADLIITHGGVGTIMTALQERKKILAAARLAQYHEHVNDHQIQLLSSFDEQGYLIYMRDLSDITPYIKKVQEFEPKMYKSNQEYFVSEIKNWIDSH